MNGPATTLNEIRTGLKRAIDRGLIKGPRIYSAGAYISQTAGHADTRLRSKLSESMFAQLQWILNYDNTPSPGQERMDHRFVLTVGWSF